MDSNIIRTWNGRTIRQREDGYLSLTDMAQACDKLVKDWFKLQSTASYLVTLVSKNEQFSIRKAESIDFAKWGFYPSQLGNGNIELLEVYRGSIGTNTGTWGHRKVAIRFAQWCSDDFAVQVDTWIEELLTKGQVTLATPTTADLLVQMALAYKEHEQRLTAIEQENIQIKAQISELEAEQHTLEMETQANTNELERFRNGHGYWYSIIGYANKKGIYNISIQEAARLGRQATAICREMGIVPERISDPRFGMINTYPEFILQEIM